MKTSIVFLSAVLFSLFFISCMKQSLFPPADAPIAYSSLPLQVSIYSIPCTDGKETLFAYNNGPSFASFDDTATYAVEWWSGDQVIGTGTKLECACGKVVQVVVRNVITEQTGQAEWRLTNCIISKD